MQNLNSLFRRIVPFKQQLNNLANHSRILDQIRYELFASNRKAQLMIPNLGSQGLDARIIFDAKEVFRSIRHKLKYHIYKKYIIIPIKIRKKLHPSEFKEIKYNLIPNSTYKITFSEILNEYNLNKMEDYIFEIKIEYPHSEIPPYVPPYIIYEMKYFENIVWSGFIIHWPNYKIPNTNFVMNNPKIKKKHHLQVLTVFAYPSNDIKMPKYNKIKYLLCNEKGEILFSKIFEVMKGSFEIVNVEDNINSFCNNNNYTVMASAKQPMATFTVSLNDKSKIVTLEHTQPLVNYCRKYDKTKNPHKYYPLKDYWYNRIDNHESFNV